MESTTEIDDSPRRLAAAVLLAAVKDVRRRRDADALAWLASGDAKPWADVCGIEFGKIIAWCASYAQRN